MVQVDADMMMQVCLHLPAGVRRRLLHEIGLASARRFNRGMAKALLTKMRQEGPGGPVVLGISSMVAMGFDHAVGDSAAWADFLSGTASRLGTSHPVAVEDATLTLEDMLRAGIEFYSPEVLSVVLAAVATRVDNPAPPLLFLAATDEETAVAIEALRSSYPDLPPVPEQTLPRVLAVLADRAGEKSREPEAVETGTVTGAPTEPQNSPDSEPDSYIDSDTRSTMSPIAAAESSEAPVVEGSDWGHIGALDWRRAKEAADRVAEAFAADQLPDGDELRLLTVFASVVQHAADELGAAVGYGVVPSREAFVAAVEQLTAVSARSDALVRLAHAEGPEHFAAVVSDVRSLALEALEEPAGVGAATVEALAALAALAVLCRARNRGEQVELSEIAALDASARAGLPIHAQGALTVALMGELLLGNPITGVAGAVVDNVDAVSTVRATHTAALDTDAESNPDLAREPSEVSIEFEVAADEDHDKDARTTELVKDLDGDATHVVEAQTIEEPAGADLEHESVVDGSNDSTEVAGEADLREAEHPVSDTAAPGPVSAAAAPAATPALAPAGEAPDMTLADLRAAALADLASSKARSLRIGPPDRVTEEPTTTPSHNEPLEPVEEHDEDDAGEVDELARFHQLDQRLLVQSRFGLASHLHNDGAHRAARQLAAYQQHLVFPAGDLASAFADAATQVSRDALSGDRVGQILAWGSAIRISTLAPAAGSVSVLSNLAPCVAASEPLTAVGDAFMQAALAGAIAVPLISELDEAENAATAAAAAAQAKIDGAPSISFGYVPSKGVYLQWLAPDGILGELLRITAENNPDRVGEVLALTTRLRGDASKRIDETFSSMRNRSKKDRVVAGARSNLVGLYNDVLDLCSSWAEQAAAAQEHREKMRAEQRSTRPLQTLRYDLAPLRESALADLEEFAIGSGNNSAEAAAYRRTAEMLTDAFDSVSGHPPTGAEPSPAWVLNHEFLGVDLLDGVTLDAETLLPTANQDLSGLVEMVAADEFDPADVYRRLAKEGRHHLTGVLIENVTAISPSQGAELSNRRTADLEGAASSLRERIASTEALLRLRQRDATLPAEAAAELAGRASLVRSNKDRNYPALHEALDEITDQVNRERDAQVAAARTQIEAAGAANTRIGEHEELLLDLVDSGEVAVALEYLEQLTTYGRLPEARDEGTQFARFFPTVPTLATANRSLLHDLHQALSTGTPNNVSADLCAAAEVQWDSLSDAARHTSGRAISAWAALANPKGRMDVKGTLRAILAIAGIEFADLAGPPRQAAGQTGRTWAKVVGVTAVGHALSPILGSAMSKDGATLRVLLVTRPVAPATLLEWTSREKPEDTILVIHLPGSFSVEDRRALANASRGRPRPPVVVLDPAVLAFLTVQPSPSRATLAALTLPFTGDSPYRDRAGRTAPEMFYGRASERREVMDLEGPSFVSGGRQLGKSALLWSARDEFDNGDTHRAVLAEILVVGGQDDPELVWPKVMKELVTAGVLREPPAGEVVTADLVKDAIIAWLDADTERRLLILLDESDYFLEADANQRFPNISAAKSLMDATNRRVKLVFAGLHSTLRFESLPNQPLAHLGKPVAVGPLRPQAAYDLLFRPLTALGYRFADPRTQPARVLAFTNNVPSLLQMFGRALVQHLCGRNVKTGPPTVITDDDITAVMDDTNLQAAFRGKYLLTLDLDHRYKVIVYAIAYLAHLEGADTGVTLPELEGECQRWWPEGFAGVGMGQLRSLASECCDLGVLAHSGGRYRMRTQTMLQLLGTANQIAETLESPKDLTVPSATASQSYRLPMPESHNPGPLTGAQTAHLFSPKPKCVVVAGSAGTGVGWVSQSLDQMKNALMTRQMGVRKLQNTTPEGMRAQLGKLTTPGLLVADLRGQSARKVAELASIGQELVAESRCVTSVVLVADHHSAPAWAASEDTIELSRVDAPGLRLWCDEVGSPFHSPVDHEALLSATSGWPKLVSDASSRDNGMGAPEQRLAWIATLLAKPGPAAEFVAAAGLDGTDPISAVLRKTFLESADLTDGGTAPIDTLAELVADVQVDGKSLAQLTRDVGFEDVEDVLVVLRACGAFSADEHGHLVPDAVLLAAIGAGASTGAHEGGQ